MLAVRQYCLRWWLMAGRDALLRAAEAAGDLPRDWSCTALVALCRPDDGWVAQVGDGAIAYQRAEVDSPWEVGFWPQNGEYLNQAEFLVGVEDAAQIQVRRIEGCLPSIALLTDGLQQLALNQRTQTAHGPFFQPLANSLKAVSDPELFKQQLIAFLASDTINQRTDDDKTLVLAVRVT